MEENKNAVNSLEDLKELSESQQLQFMYLDLMIRSISLENLLISKGIFTSEELVKEIESVASKVNKTVETNQSVESNAVSNK